METQRQVPAGATTTATNTSALDDALAGGLAADALLSAVAAGKDTRQLTGAQRRALLASLHHQLGLNPLSGAVMFLLTNGRETLYVKKEGTDQIARREKLTRETLKGPCVETMEGVKVVICQVCVKHPDGRAETCTATLPFSAGGLVNDLMKVETKAKRRATLSLCGLGMLAEDEIETIPGARTVPADVLDEVPAERDPEREAIQAEAAPPSAPLTSPALDEFYARVAEIEMSGEAVAVWLKHRAGLHELAEAARREAWDALVKCIARVGKMKQDGAKAWLKKAVAEEDARAALAGQGSSHAAA